jgi:hypothetical protein
MKILYTTEAVVEGGRAGHGRTADGRLAVQLSVPKELGGEGGPGTNPEELFAVGYAACFQSGLLSLAQGSSMLPIRRSRPVWESGPPVTGVLVWRSRSIYTRRTFPVLTPRISCDEPTRSALTRTPRAATSTFRSASTAHS